MRPIVCLGAVAPAALTYARLQEALRDEARLLLIDPLCFAEPLPADYSVDREIEAILCAADTAGFDTFDLVGYSVSASLALLLATRQPDRIRTLTLIEPPWIGTEPSCSADAAFLASLDGTMAVPPSQRYLALLAAVSPPDTDPSVYLPHDPPTWLVQRPVRFELLWQALRASRIELSTLTSFPHPVYLPVGGRTHPWFRLAARRLADLFPGAAGETYPDLTHLDPPQSRATERFAQALRELWNQSPAETGAALTR
jgi:pimeloyl-ACP methyl ester carboxylesterase